MHTSVLLYWRGPRHHLVHHVVRVELAGGVVLGNLHLAAGTEWYWSAGDGVCTHPHLADRGEVGHLQPRVQPRPHGFLVVRTPVSLSHLLNREFLVVTNHRSVSAPGRAPSPRWRGMPPWCWGPRGRPAPPPASARPPPPWWGSRSPGGSSAWPAARPHSPGPCR